MVLMIINNKTCSDRSFTVGICSFLLVGDLCAPGHAHAINISKDSPIIYTFPMWGLSPCRDKPMRKYMSIESNSTSYPWIMNLPSVGSMSELRTLEGPIVLVIAA